MFSDGYCLYRAPMILRSMQSSRPLLRPQVMISLNQDSVAIHFWCFMWHMRLNPKKTKSLAVSRPQTYAPGHGDLALGGAEPKEVKSLSNLEVTFDSKFTFETHSREVVSKAARSLGIVHRAGKLFDCLPVLKRFFSCGPTWSIVPPCGCRLRSLI